MKDLVLTPRERNLVEGFSKGWTNKEIANHFHLTEGTVKAHYFRMRNKYGRTLNRATFPLLLAREHERNQAIKLNMWVLHWRDTLPPEALLSIREILAGQVAPFLGEVQRPALGKAPQCLAS